MSLFNKEFPLSVIEKLDHYVYLLRDPRTHQVFYIGKGMGNRIFAHINAALKDGMPSDKLDKIQEIRANNLDVIHIVHRHGLTEKEAFEVEAALIDFIGLNDLTNKIQGQNSDDRGRMLVSEIISKYQAHVAEITQPAILITVNQFYRRGMTSEMLYEITRGKWVIGARRNKVKYAFSVYKGIIREVYEIECWYPAPIEDSEIKRTWINQNLIDTQVKQRNRWQFEGIVANDLQHYVGASTEKYQICGAQNPIRYVNC